MTNYTKIRKLVIGSSYFDYYINHNKALEVAITEIVTDLLHLCDNCDTLDREKIFQNSIEQYYKQKEMMDVDQHT